MKLRFPVKQLQNPFVCNQPEIGLRFFASLRRLCVCRSKIRCPMSKIPLDKHPGRRTKLPVDKMRSALTQNRERTWAAAIEQGLTTAQIAADSGVSIRYVQQVIARARASRPESSSSTTPDGIPRLELRQSPNPCECDHRQTGTLTTGAIGCLDCDSTSTDGGTTWIPPGPDTPKLTVLVPHGHGSRRERLEPRPWQAPPDPPGPTSYKPADGLSGGVGGRKRAGSRDRALKPENAS
jgi:transposase-like protein